MSVELQKQFGIFAGEKVIYKDYGGHLSTRIVADVSEVVIREGYEIIAVILDGDENDGGYVDFSDIITLEQALEFFGLKVIKLGQANFSLEIEGKVDTVGILAKI